MIGDRVFHNCAFRNVANKYFKIKPYIFMIFYIIVIKCTIHTRFVVFTKFFPITFVNAQFIAHSFNCIVIISKEIIIYFYNLILLNDYFKRNNNIYY